jgi:aryl-alcohol dehydrogenase-like predicted oxidoreductase
MIRTISKISLGTVQFGLTYGVANNSGQVSFEETKDIIELARQSGIDTLDTAIMYGNSEEVLGEIGLDNWNVITKIPEAQLGIDNIKAWLKQEIINSMARLGVAKLYAVMLHSTNVLSSDHARTYWNGLLELKQQGLIKKIGYSIYNPDELNNHYNNFQPDIVQAPYNVLDSRLETSGWLQRMREDSVEIHVRSIFLQGLLLMNYEQRPVYFRRWDNLWIKWHRWLETEKITALEAALWFVLKDKRITTMVIGVNSAEQLREIMCASKKNVVEKLYDFSSSDVELINPSKWML